MSTVLQMEEGWEPPQSERQLAERQLAERLAAIDDALRACIAPRGYVALELVAAMRHAVFPGGQRWRPLLTLAAAELAGAGWRRALPAACAVELVHCCSLVFDDLPCMDDAPVRRGAPSVHVRFGEGVAVLTGLGLLTTAFGLLARSPRPRRATRLAARYLGPTEMLTGQAVDLLAAVGGPAGDSPEILRRIQNRKTSALVLLALHAGALYGRVTRGQSRALTVFGREVGDAYQLIDDLEDVREDTRPHPGAAASGRDAQLARIDHHLRTANDALRGQFGDTPALRPLAAFTEILRARAGAPMPAVAQRGAC